MEEQYEKQRFQNYDIGNNHYQITRVFNNNKDIKSIIVEKITSKIIKMQN